MTIGWADGGAEMGGSWRDAVASQFDAAVTMLENAVRGCPPALWDREPAETAFWYVAYHTIFWLDYYLADSPDEE